MRPLVIALVVGLVCWIAPLVQQFQSDGGNLSDLWKFWTANHDHLTGWSTAARLIDAQLALPAPWFTGHETVSPFTDAVLTPWHIPLALFLLIGALVFAIRRADRQSTRLCVFALGLLAAAFVSVSRIVDTPFVYIVHWLWITGAVTWLAIVWTAVRALAFRSRPAHRVGGRQCCDRRARRRAPRQLGARRLAESQPGRELGLGDRAAGTSRAARRCRSPCWSRAPTTCAQARWRRP